MKIATDTESLGASLKSASALVVLADTEAPPSGTAATLLASAPNVEKVILVTKIGKEEKERALSTFFFRRNYYFFPRGAE